MKNIKKILCGIIILSCFWLISVKANNTVEYKTDADYKNSVNWKCASGQVISKDVSTGRITVSEPSVDSCNAGSSDSYIPIGIEVENIKEDTIEGTVVEKSDNYITLDSLDEQNPGLMEVTYPDGFDAANIEAGDKVKIYYTGEILESWPAQIRKTIKIEKID